MSVVYSLHVNLRSALLGEPIIAVLRCFASASAPRAFTFQHRSLVLELTKSGLPEPLLTFPNRFAVENGDQLVRFSMPGGIEALAEGEERTRAFDLAALFPEPVLDVGTLAITYRIEEASPPIGPAPVTIHIESGPEAVPHLLRLLDAESSALRFKASALLSRMTAYDASYDPEAPPSQRFDAIRRWQSWWETQGASFPWNFESNGATFGEVPAAAPPSGRSASSGGIAYPNRPFR